MLRHGTMAGATALIHSTTLCGVILATHGMIGIGTSATTPITMIGTGRDATMTHIIITTTTTTHTIHITQVITLRHPHHHTVRVTTQDTKMVQAIVQAVATQVQVI